MKFIDLNHPVSNAMPTYPSDLVISIIREKDYVNAQNGDIKVITPTVYNEYYDSTILN